MNFFFISVSFVDAFNSDTAMVSVVRRQMTEHRLARFFFFFFFFCRTTFTMVIEMEFIQLVPDNLYLMEIYFFD